MTKIIKSDGPIKRIVVTEPRELNTEEIKMIKQEVSDFIRFGNAVNNLINEIIKALKINKIVQWLSKHIN